MNVLKQLKVGIALMSMVVVASGSLHAAFTQREAARFAMDYNKAVEMAVKALKTKVKTSLGYAGVELVSQKEFLNRQIKQYGQNAIDMRLKEITKQNAAFFMRSMETLITKIEQMSGKKRGNFSDLVLEGAKDIKLEEFLY